MCQFAHGEQDLRYSRHYKTELCRHWDETGTCARGAECQFAHGESELRPIPRNASYKTRPCVNFTLHGYCEYGRRCQYIHDASLSFSRS